MLTYPSPPVFRRQLLSHPACSDCSATLHKPYLCLDCAFIGCPTSPRPHSRRPITKSCIAKHLHASSHTFAFAIHSGHLYCSACAAGIHDPRFDALYHREKSRTQGRACGPLLDDVERYSHLPRQPISTRVPRGIHNLGATCFLSVILQSFLHNPLLRNYFLADRHNSDLCYKASPSDSCMACEVDAMFRDFFLHDVDKSTHPHDPWIPNSFLYAVWKTQESSELSQSGQQDSHELYISALNTLHTALTAPGRHPASRKPEIPQWPNENAGKGMDESKIREVEQGYGVYHTGSGDGTPEFASKLCDCIIHRTFSGVLQSDVRCLVCGYRSSTHDPVLDLSVDLRPPSLIAQQERELQALLDIEDGGAGLSADGKPKKKKQKKHGDGGGGGGTTTPAAAAATATSSAGSPAPTVPTSTSSGTFAKNRFTEHESQDLVECLRRYCSSEQLPSSSYSCPQCGPVEASKQLSLCRLPPVLAIQLKRFEHTPTSSYKIETRVRFPQRLDVHEFVTPSVLERGAAGRDVQESLAYDDFVYDLFCVIVHEGTLNTGHYWCFCKWQGEVSTRANERSE